MVQENLTLNFSRVDGTGLSRHSALSYSMAETVGLGPLTRNWAYGAFITCCYIVVVVILMNSLARHFLATSKDTTSDIAGEGNALCI